MRVDLERNLDALADAHGVSVEYVAGMIKHVIETCAGDHVDMLFAVDSRLQRGVHVEPVAPLTETVNKVQAALSSGLKDVVSSGPNALQRESLRRPV